MRRRLVNCVILAFSLSLCVGCSGAGDENAEATAENAAADAADATANLEENADPATDDEHRKPVNAEDIGEN
jgi:hypothetical protein